MRVSIRSAAAIASVLAVAYAAAPTAVQGSPRFSPRLRPGQGIPALPQLLANFAVLRRPQTAADRSWRPPPPGLDAHRLTTLTRLARTLPNGTRIFLTVERYTGPGWPSVYPVGSYELDIDIVPANSNDSAGTNFGPNVNYTVFPLTSVPPGLVRLGSAGASVPTWAGIIPDGASRVRWAFECLGTRCARRHLTINVRVAGNVAAASLPIARPEIESTGAPLRDWQPLSATWYGPGGHVVARYRLGPHNLSAPPFIKAG